MSVSVHTLSHMPTQATSYKLHSNPERDSVSRENELQKDSIIAAQTSHGKAPTTGAQLPVHFTKTMSSVWTKLTVGKPPHRWHFLWSIEVQGTLADLNLNFLKRA